jgi:hypothetical protein
MTDRVTAGTEWHRHRVTGMLRRRLRGLAFLRDADISRLVDSVLTSKPLDDLADYVARVDTVHRSLAIQDLDYDQRCTRRTLLVADYESERRAGLPVVRDDAELADPHRRLDRCCTTCAALATLYWIVIAAIFVKHLLIGS